MKLDEIQDIEVLRNMLKSLMCKCIKEIELTNFEGNTKKIYPGEYLKFDKDDIDYIDDINNYYVTDEEGYSINSYDIEDIKEYFKFPKEGEA